MTYDKKSAVTEIIKINKLFESSKVDNPYNNISTIIENLFKDNFNIYKKKVLNIIINTILYKKNINDNEKGIIIKIISLIFNKINSNKTICYDILINIIDTIYLRKSIGNKKLKIIQIINKNFHELNNYIAFAKLESEELLEIIPSESSVVLTNYSQIKVYIYKVFHNDENIKGDKKEKYSFKRGIKKINKKNNTIINPNQNQSIKYTPNNSKIYSKDIIATPNNGNVNITNSLKNHTNISTLYNLYRTMSSRTKISNFNPDSPLKNNLKNNLYNLTNNLIEKSRDIMEAYFSLNISNNNINVENIDDDGEIIYNIVEEDNNTKIIVMGDQHGSLHSFFRIFIRLFIEEIIDGDFKLKEGYKIIFLGDIIDRGNFGIEIMYIILKLITVNNNGDQDNLSNLKVILNRGNHEEYSTFEEHGFYDEIIKKFSREENDIITNFIDLYKYCPSAIILKHKNIKYWLCHGGFDIKFSNEIIIIPPNKCMYRKPLYVDVDGRLISQIRWNDFKNEDTNSNGDRWEGYENASIKIGLNTLNKFLKLNKINFIIRGHQDNISNAMLLYSGNSDEGWFVLNKKDNTKLYSEQPNNNEILKYPNVNGYSNEEVVTINPILFKNNNKFINEDTILYPVLTISNNSDIERWQYDDSYIVIE